MRFMIDSNIYDVLAADPFLYARCKELQVKGRMKFITTHIQRDEIARTSDPRKRQLLEQINEPSAVPTTGFAWDVSRFDLSEWARQEDENLIEMIIGGNNRNIADALIATTAKNKTDVFVTNDKPLRKRLARINAPLKVWTQADFIKWVKAQ
jgi:predicted nucleic acid-binding protein